MWEKLRLGNMSSKRACGARLTGCHSSKQSKHRQSEIGRAANIISWFSADPSPWLRHVITPMNSDCQMLPNELFVNLVNEVSCLDCCTILSMRTQVSSEHVS